MIASLGQVRHYPLAVRLSRIHGKGLFAEVGIPLGALIYESDEYTVTPQPIYGSIQRTATRHLLEAVLRWENHSCNPNSSLKFTDTAVQLVSTRPIRAGEEIVCDYRTTEGSIPMPFRCNCGHCDGIIIG